jgi:hypothetical protein
VKNQKWNSKRLKSTTSAMCAKQKSARPDHIGFSFVHTCSYIFVLEDFAEASFKIKYEYILESGIQHGNCLWRTEQRVLRCEFERSSARSTHALTKSSRFDWTTTSQKSTKSRVDDWPCA